MEQETLLDEEAMLEEDTGVTDNMEGLDLADESILNNELEAAEGMEVQ